MVIVGCSISLYIFIFNIDDRYNIPRVQDVSRELNDWVYPRDENISRLLQTNPRELPECVRRFTQDIYLCVYIQSDISMY